MAGMSNYLENKLVDFVLRGQSFTPPTTLYVALCTATPGDTDTGSTITEVSGGNYSRQSLTSNTTNWYTTNGNNDNASSGTNGTTGNATTISWSSVTWSGTVTAVALCDASSGGNMLFYTALAAPKTIASGDSVSFATNSLTIQIDN